MRLLKRRHVVAKQRVSNGPRRQAVENFVPVGYVGVAVAEGEVRPGEGREKILEVLDLSKPRLPLRV